MACIEPWRITERIGEDPCAAFAWPRPDFNGAAHEFLIGLLSTAAAPADDEAWDRWWREPPSADVLKQRFSTIVHAFNLDGPGPRFLQDLDPLEDAKDKEVAALLIDAPGEETLRDNADLFVKRGATPTLSRAAAAMALYTMSSYAPAGGGGGGGHFTSLRGGGPMTTLAVADHPEHGRTLWGRLWPNVESREQIEARAVDATLDDDHKRIFPWLAPTRIYDPKAGGGQTTPRDVHPLQVYWGMPRRIRLMFEEAKGRKCELTAVEDSVVVARYRTKTRGTKYSEGFEHPLTPYYRQASTGPKLGPKLAVHPKPGNISYRLWPSLVVQSKGSAPAQVIRHWGDGDRAPRDACRFAAFGYDMDRMKACAWFEADMPLWHFGNKTTRDTLAKYIQQTTAGADTVGRLVMNATKSALHHKTKRATGDYRFITERFYRDTEAAFFAALAKAVSAIRKSPNSEDPAFEVRRDWASDMKQAALRLFDEYAPSEGLENRNMHRHVKARCYLTLALRGRGKTGKRLFETVLGIPSPETTRTSSGQREAA